MNLLRFNQKSVSKLILALSFIIFSWQITQAQTYTGSVTFGPSSEYSFDYSVDCDASGTSAILTVTFTSTVPTDLVPQIWDGAATWLTMSGSDPYTLDLMGLSNCDFSFFYWFAYEGGGLYQSPEAITPDNTTLPISLLDFTVTKENDRSLYLEWMTSMEINSDYFGIELSKDGIQWEKIAQVPAAGYSNNTQRYNYSMDDVTLDDRTGETFYIRLRLTDIDGTFEYSQIESVDFSKNQERKITIYPNPTTDQVSLNVPNFETESKNVLLKVFNEIGQEVLAQAVNNHRELIDVTNFTKGNYYFVVLQNEEVIFSTTISKVE